MSATTAATTYAPGTKLSLTVDRVPQSKSGKDTIARLMRLDPSNAKALRGSQKAREEKNNFYIRGNRLWGSRAKCGKVVRVAQGETWTMTFTPQIGPDLASVNEYLKVSSK